MMSSSNLHTLYQAYLLLTKVHILTMHDCNGQADRYAQVRGLPEVCNLAKHTSARRQLTLSAQKQTEWKGLTVMTMGMIDTRQPSSTHTSNLKAASAKTPTTS